MNQPLVSVIIPTYKRPDTLPRAINSVLNQTYENFEIIVVDDNDPSTHYRKETEEVMTLYKNNPKVTYLQHSQNKNGSAARNTGFNASHGEFIMFLDDDDEFLPNKMKAQVNCLLNHDDTWGACYCKYIRKHGNKIVSRSKENREGWVALEELKRNFWHGGSTGLVVRRNVFVDIGGFDESFIRNQDYEFTIKLTLKYKLAFCNVLGHVNYVHPKTHYSKSFEEVTEQFIQTFKGIIDTLTEKQKSEVYTMMNLQLFRNMLEERRSFKEIVGFVKGINISFILLTRYMFYLIYRKIFKVSCGFIM